MLNENVEFKPDWVSPPGDTIVDILDEREISVEEFSRIIGKTTHISSQLLEGKEPLTPEIAEKLSTAFGSTVDFWLAREREYRGSESIETDVATLSEWVKMLPIKDMKKFGWIPNTRDQNQLILHCLEFFEVFSLQQWISKYRIEASGSAFRKSLAFNSCDFATTSWLRRGEQIVSGKKYNTFAPEKLNNSVEKIKKLTWFKDPNLFLNKLESILGAAGVAFSVLKAPQGCTVSGATRILDNGTPHIQVSFRYLSDDHFWFTIFHEIGHLVLHIDKLPFYEVKGMELSQYEREANEYAATKIVPLQHFEELDNLINSRHAIISFAKKMGVAPGLIVGQMQHLKIIGYNQMNFLKRRFRWVD